MACVVIKKCHLKYYSFSALNELDYEEGPVQVKRLEKPPLPAREICLELIAPQIISENQTSEMEFLLSATFVDKIIVSGQYLIYYYFGMCPKFKVCRFNFLFDLFIRSTYYINLEIII